MTADLITTHTHREPGYPNSQKFRVIKGKSTHEHIGQFIAQLGELADTEAFCVRLFSLSLTGTSFAWYTTLPPNSISSWGDLEQKLLYPEIPGYKKPMLSNTISGKTASRISLQWTMILFKRKIRRYPVLYASTITSKSFGL
jgi:hypothetical protein